jgi:hypothetical protein
VPSSTAAKVAVSPARSMRREVDDSRHREPVVAASELHQVTGDRRERHRPDAGLRRLGATACCSSLATAARPRPSGPGRCHAD